MSTVTMPEVSAATTELADPDWIPAPLYRFSLERYEELVESGAFGKQDRFHLINGYLVAKMTQNPPHITADDLCGGALQQVIPPGWYIRASKPVRIPSRVSKPEPDRAVVRGTVRDYSRRDPDPSDVALLVEVADSSLREDRLGASLWRRRHRDLLDHQPGGPPGRSLHRSRPVGLPDAHGLSARTGRAGDDRRGRGRANPSGGSLALMDRRGGLHRHVCQSSLREDAHTKMVC